MVLTKDDVGKLFTITGKDAWKMTEFIWGASIIDAPAPDVVVMTRLDPAAAGVIRDNPESLNIRQFKRLVVEEK